VIVPGASDRYRKVGLSPGFRFGSRPANGLTPESVIPVT
jgi:hypothetical protein